MWEPDGAEGYVGKVGVLLEDGTAPEPVYIDIDRAEAAALRLHQLAEHRDPYCCSVGPNSGTSTRSRAGCHSPSLSGPCWMPW
ncbi:hypothetical protein [Streptomyces sp. NPDC056049]|uniref:hypothetical protein n=1 Tax=Streptomyces sp. NPDC056049 TaxID=3345693 RepID=UPI0035DAA128